MQITKELVEYVSTISKIELSEKQSEKILTELNAIVEYMEILNQINTNDANSDSRILPLTNVFREDQVSPSFCREDILKNAPEQDFENFIVPKTVE